MNTNANNLNKDQLNEQQLEELENDAVWSLLRKTEESSSIEPSPMFARNVMREIRLNHSQQSPSSLWDRLFAPRFNKLALSLCATVAVTVLVLSQMPGQDSTSGSPTSSSTSSSDTTIEEIAELEEILIEDELDDFTDEMLEIVNQDPFFISEEEIELAMQM